MLTTKAFQQQRNEAIREKYKELRGQKTSRPDAFEILGKEFELSCHTLESITSRRSYQPAPSTNKNT